MDTDKKPKIRKSLILSQETVMIVEEAMKRSKEIDRVDLSFSNTVNSIILKSQSIKQNY